MRKHFEGKKFSRERDYYSEDNRKHKKPNRNEEKNWKNHLFDQEDEPVDDDFFHFDDDED